MSFAVIALAAEQVQDAPLSSRDEYMESLGDPRFQDVMAKFGAFTDIEPLRQFDEVVT